MNKIFLSGNLGNDPKPMPNTEKTGCTFSVATRAWSGDTDWHKVKAWGKTAEFCLNHLKKGSGVNVVGSMRYGKFTAQDGTVVKTADVFASEIEFAPKAAKNTQDTGDFLSTVKADDYTEDLF